MHQTSLCSKRRVTQPWLQAMHGLISSSRPSRALFGQSGSASSVRPTAMKSARPVATISSASAGSRILPTAMTGTPTASFTRSANGSSTPSSRAMGGIM